MANVNQVRLFVLPKSRATRRLADKRKLTIDDIKQNGVPDDQEFYIYVRVQEVDDTAASTSNGQRRVRCVFDELNTDDETTTGKRGALYLSGRYLIEMVQCIELPAIVFLCNFQLLSAYQKITRINPFDVELELNGERSRNGAILKVEQEEEPVDYRDLLAVEYVTLKDLTETPKLSIYGVIKALAVSENAAGLKLTLTDPSIGFHNHITCHLAANQMDQLPTQTKIGDVLRLHRISARLQHGDVIQLFGRMGKAGLSWLRFDGTPGSDLTPQPSSITFTIKDADYETARHLRSWFWSNKNKLSSIKQSPTAAGADVDRVTKLKDFKLKSYGNLLMQVLGVFESIRSTRPIIVRAWDGTKCTRESVRVDPDNEGLPILAYDRDLYQSVTDYAVDVFVYDEHRETARQLQSGDIVWFSNVHFGFVKPPDYMFMLHGGDGGQHERGIRPMKDTDPLVIEFREQFDSIMP